MIASPLRLCAVLLAALATTTPLAAAEREASTKVDAPTAEFYQLLKIMDPMDADKRAELARTIVAADPQSAPKDWRGTVARARSECERKLQRLLGAAAVAKYAERLRTDLDARRKAALTLLADTQRYPGTQRDGPGQKEFDGLLAKLRELWDDPLPRVTADEPVLVKEMPVYEQAAADADELDAYLALFPAAGAAKPAGKPAAKRALKDHFAEAVQQAWNPPEWRQISEANAQTGYLDDEERGFLVLINRMRLMVGVPPLENDVRLFLTARGHSQDMAERNFHSYDSPVPGKRTVNDRTRQQGYVAACAEGIRWSVDNAKDALEFLMHSGVNIRVFVDPRWKQSGFARHLTFWNMLYGPLAPFALGAPKPPTVTFLEKVLAAGDQATVDQRLQLAGQALALGLTAQAADQYTAVLKLDHGNAKAQAGLKAMGIGGIAADGTTAAGAPGAAGAPAAAADAPPIIADADRAAVPAADAQAKAVQNLKTVFKDDFARRQDAALAVKLLDAAVGEVGDPAQRFALLRESINAAGRSGEAGTAMRATDLLVAIYAVDKLPERLAAVAAVAKTLRLPFENSVFAQWALRTAGQAIIADDFDGAAKAVGAALATGAKHKDAALTARSKELDADVRDLAKEAKLLPAVGTAQPSADEAVPLGRFACLLKGDWEHGLPLLARGSDAALKAAAEKELAPPKTPAEWVAVADAWFEIADKQAGRAKAHLLDHAAAIYRRALPELTGFTKVRAETRLAELPKPVIAAFGAVDLWPMLALEAGAYQGAWKAENGALIVEKNSAGDHLTMPVVPRGGYLFEAEFERLSDDGEAMFLLPVGNVSINVFVFATGCTIHRVNGSMLTSDNSAVKIVPKTHQHFAAKVVQGGPVIAITITVDGQQAFAWQGAANTVFTSHTRAIPSRPGALGLGAWNAKVAFYQAKLTLLSGRTIALTDLAAKP